MDERPPILEYGVRRSHFMFPTATVVSFVVGFLCAVLLNALPYIHTYGAWQGDGIATAGFPFTFYEFGGYVPHLEFGVSALLVDAVFAVVMGIGTACVWRFRRSIPQSMVRVWHRRRSILESIRRWW